MTKLAGTKFRLGEDFSVTRESQITLSSAVSPKTFGAVGNGVADDTAAIRAAIAHADVNGLELDWGRSTYRITSECDLTFTGLMRWVSRGARILYDPPAGTYSALRLRLKTGFNYLRGDFTVDVNRKAHVGIRAEPITNGTQEPDLLMEDVTVLNTHRASTSFTDGDGIYVVGSFGRVHLIRPKVKDSTMAVGAGIVGSMGIFGITIGRASPSTANNCPKYTKLEDVWIENVWSEDPDYVSDQDGIRVFTRYGGTATAGLNNPNTCEVVGGRVINVRGRSIKLQVESGRVSGVKLYRTTLANNGTAGVLTQNADIESQAGATTISDIEFQYDGYSHVSVVRCIQADETVVYASPPQISNIRGVVTGADAPARVITLTANDGTSLTQDFPVTVSGVNVESETAIGVCISHGASHSSSNNVLVASNLVGSWGTALISLATATSATVVVTNAIQRGSAVALVSGATSGRKVFAVNCQNFTGQRLDLEGTGTPEGAVTAPIGSTFRRTDGGANTTLYVKESGTGDTGWVAK